MDLFFDVDLCTGCGACELACAKTYHGEPRLKLQTLKGKFPMTGVCRQCERSPCVEVCPKKAIERVGETVVVNEILCVGCRSCSIVCPFGNISFQEARHVSTKCDECVKNVGEGKVPPCAAVCPTGALRFCEFEEMEKVASSARRRREMIGPKMFAWRPK